MLIYVTINEETLELLILPESKETWGDFKEASQFLKSINNRSINTMIRYTENGLNYIC